MIILANGGSIDPQAFYQFALIVSFLVSLGAGAASVAAFFNSRRTQRREVTFVREMVSRDELMHVVKDVERVEAEQAKIRAEIKENRLLAEAELGKIRAENKEDRLLGMAAAEARQKETLSRISRLDEVLGNMLDRVPR